MLRPLIAALSSPLLGSDHPVNLVPDGVFRAVDGRPFGIDGWRLDAETAQSLLDRVRSRKTKLAINYEHPTATGEPVPAAGWIERERLSYAPGIGITAPVQWTSRAKAMIDAGEYAYLSPVISYDPKTGAVRDLHLAGLTNTPALDTLQPLAALAERLGLDFPTDPQQESFMDLAALRQTLGLADDAAESDILEAVKAIKAKADETTALSEQITALKASAPDLAQYVPKAVFDEALASLKEAGAKAEETEKLSLIDRGLAEGRVPGEQTVAWLKGQPLDAVQRYLADAPVIAALKGTQTGGHQPAKAKADDAETFTAELKAEFGDEAAWNAYRKALDAGDIKIVSGGKGA
jgi:phage I-like protein